MSTQGGSNQPGMVAGLMTILVGCVSAPITANDGFGDASESSDADEPQTGTGTETDSGTTTKTEITTAQTDETDGTETDETESETDDGGDFNACLTAEGTLSHAALLLDSGEDRAWVIDGADLLELELMGPPGDLVELQGAARANRIAVARHLDYEGECCEEGCEEEFAAMIIHGFDRSSGVLQWARELNGHLTGGLYMGDDGWITGIYITQVWLDGFAMNDEQSLMLTDHLPLGPVVDGWLTAVEKQQYVFGWLALADQSWTPVEPPPLDPDYVTVAEDDLTLEYVAENGLGLAFVRATPDQIDVFELPIDPLTSGLQRGSSAGRFRLLRTYDDPSAELVVRIDVESGEVIVVDYPEPPAGWTWFDCPARQIKLTAQGALLYVLRDFASVRLWAFSPESEQWSEVGLAVGPVEFLNLQQGDFENVHPVTTTAQYPEPACPTGEWGEPPDDALQGQSLQLVRNAPPLALALPFPGGLRRWSIDEHERCVAYPDEEMHWRVRALEGEGEEAEFGPVRGPWIWLD